MQEPHDPRDIRRRAADGELISPDMEIDGRELFLDEPQGFVMAAQRLNHLVGIVEEDYFGTDAGKCVGKLPRRALAGDKPALSVS
jgi:hypothetical protein